MGKRTYNSEKAQRAIGLKIRQLRNARGWTLEDAEEHSDISWQRHQKIESGRNIGVETIVKLANLYGVHPSVLLEDI